MEKLDLIDVSIHEKDWKSFKKTAEQIELLILGIGVKYRIITKRIWAYLSALGIVLSVALGLILISTMEDMSAGLVVLIAGYVIFSFLSSKSIRYNDSLTKIKGKLNKENKNVLKQILKVSAAAAFFDALIRFIVMYITIPYQALMLVIGMVAPNFVVSKNGLLIAIPKGYDIGNLMSIGGYYASHSLSEEWEKTYYENSHRYEVTVINNMGCEQKLHSPDGKAFYDENGGYVGYSNDNGKTIIPD